MTQCRCDPTFLKKNRGNRSQRAIKSCFAGKARQKIKERFLIYEHFNELSEANMERTSDEGIGGYATGFSKTRRKQQEIRCKEACSRLSVTKDDRKPAGSDERGRVEKKKRPLLFSPVSRSSPVRVFRRSSSLSSPISFPLSC